MAGPEVKNNIIEAADAFKDDKINKVEADKIANVLDPAKTKPSDIQEFVKDSKTYPAFLDGIINNIEDYTKVDEKKNSLNLTNTITGTPANGNATKKLQIEENNIPYKTLSPEERKKIVDDAKKFLETLKNEKAKLTTPTGKALEAPKTTVAEVKERAYDKEKPLSSMLDAINDKLPDDKKIKQTAEEIHNNMKNTIMAKVTEVVNDKLKNNEKKEKIGNAIIEWTKNELTDARVDNLILGGMYVSINSINKKINAPEKITTANFSPIAVNILSDVNSIDALLKSNGDIMGSIIEDSKNKISDKIKNTFPKMQVAFMSKNELEYQLKDLSNDPAAKGLEYTQDPRKNPVTAMFMDEIKIDTPTDAIHYIEKNNRIQLSTEAEIGKDGQAIQDNLSKKIKDIVSKVPTTPYEKEAMKTELLQNKFGGWTKELISGLYAMAKGTMFEGLLKSLLGEGFLEKVVLTKERNFAIEGKKLYTELKGKDAKLENSSFKTSFDKSLDGTQYIDVKKIAENVNMLQMTEALNKCGKFIKPIDKSLLTSDGKYDQAKLTGMLNTYMKNLGDNWEKSMYHNVPGNKKKGESEKNLPYNYKDLIKNEADLVENFMQFIQTGKTPDGYADKKIFEDMNNIGVRAPIIPPVVPLEAPGGTPPPKKEEVVTTKTPDTKKDVVVTKKPVNKPSVRKPAAKKS